ncbi:MAG TPA: alpha/beta fold hydrolase [Gemmatimonadales bacterium]|nr:alpha/beta fold hydrolase [Gemmatimonadales bacterium]
MHGLDIDLTVYPDECDAFGHLNQASFLALFERARWEMLARGPGMDVFTRQGAWPAVRRAAIEYHLAAYPGDVLRFHQDLIHHGRTSFTLRQTARRTRDDALISTAEFVFVCINREGRPVPVPPEFGELLNAQPAPRGDTRRLTVNGVNLLVQERGSGPAILFIHGYPLDHTIWGPQVDALEGWRRIAPDLRGMGRSDAPDLGYSMSTYAADLAALLDALGADRVVLCGQSMGGYIAFEFLRRWRDRVSALVLMATKAEADTADARRARDTAGALARESGALGIAEEMVPKVLGPTAPADLVKQVRAMMVATPVPGIVGALGAMRDRADSTGLLATLVGLPTLVIAGADDQVVTVSQATAMAGAIPGAQLVVAPGAAHIPSLASPAIVSDAMRSFLSRLG